jgi:hypothetical protein
MHHVEGFHRRHSISRCLGIVVLTGCCLLADPSDVLFHAGERAGTAALAQTPAANPPDAPATVAPTAGAPPPAGENAPAPAAPTPAAPPVTPAAPVIAKAPELPLSADDVSWLFPTPTKAEDLANLISMADLAAPDPQDPAKRDRVWSDAVFAQFLGIAASPAALVAGSTDRIGLPDEVKSIAAWHIAGVRFDAGAPGLSDAIIKQFGQSPQIRLILQPVTKNADGSITVHDIAAHLIFGFVNAKQDPPAQAGCLRRPAPDLAAFQSIVADIAALRTRLGSGALGADKISTAAKPLGVHPGLVDPTTASNVRSEMKAILERHLSSQRLSAMAIMGLPASSPEPWIFLSMAIVPPGAVPQLPNGGVIPVHGPALDGQAFAQLLNPAGSSHRVIPTPHTNNLVPITCVNAAAPVAGPPVARRRGVATADLFPDPPPSANRTAKVLNVLNVIADPTKSHFFNTDCISCHTETRRAMELLNPKDMPKINAAPLPNGSWNVRNFGWSPLVEGPEHGTVSRRTAAETAAVVNFINARLLPK